MANNNSKMYNSSEFGPKEVELVKLFENQKEDAKRYFINYIKPRLDRSYKLYIAYGGDRQKKIKTWQANVFVPYVQAVVETLMPRILDARPEFTVKGRSEEDHAKSEKLQQLADYIWEIAGMDATSEDFVRSCVVYGTGFLQVSWKKVQRELKFLSSEDPTSKKLKWKKETRVFYDAPYAEWVDNYSLWYDWHNTARETKQYWFKRLVLTSDQIKLRYPGADKKRLDMAFAGGGGDTVDYASVRNLVKTTHDGINRSAGAVSMSSYLNEGTQKYEDVDEATMKMYEVFEWWRPFDDAYAVMVGASSVPIFKDAVMPIPFDFKESPFIEATYMKLPGEFEGIGIPLILENPQIMLNLIKNQRLDASTLSIHRMWIVNPLANINKEELVTRPFGIIYSIDPQGVREVQFSDIKSSAYKEEEMLKSDMRYSSGVDDFSMGAGGNASSATEVRHLRESTLERVRLFVNHLGDAYSIVLRYWIDMSRQFFTKEMTIRIIGDNGVEMFPLIEKNDLMGRFDFRASVLPSIAGQSDIKKKQDMDMFQLLSEMPFIDLKKLTSKVISEWGWTVDSISKGEEEAEPMVDENGNPIEGGMPMDGQMTPEMMAQLQGGGGAPASSKNLSPDALNEALAMLRKPGEASGASPFAQMASPVNLLNGGSVPPTAPAIGKGTNSRGLNRGGKVNTNIPMGGNSSPESSLLNRAFNIQR